MVSFAYLTFQSALRRKGLRGEPVSNWLAAAVNVPFVTVLSSVTALAGWTFWVVKSESARRSTHEVLAGFGLALQREPWPLWAPLPVSIPLLALLALLLLAAWARERIQRRVAAGGTPFSDACPSESGSESASYTPSTRRGLSPREYFSITGGAAVAAWLVHAWVVSLLVSDGVWAAGMTSLHSATKSIKPYALGWTNSAAAGAVESGVKLLSEIAASMASAMSVTQGTAPSADSGAGDLGRAGWGPSGYCPPSCVDLSAWSYYLGNDTCCCNTIGGLFAAEAHTAAASRSLTFALAGLALLWASLSWLLLAASCQFAHTECEAMLCSGAAGGSTAASREPLLGLEEGA